VQGEGETSLTGRKQKKNHGLSEMYAWERSRGYIGEKLGDVGYIRKSLYRGGGSAEATGWWGGRVSEG